MQIIREVRQLPAALIALRAGGKSLALVPTMGALHAGHMALIEEARGKADRVVASIFVNPLQFNDKADLERYPRTEEADAAKLSEAGCDVLWLPTPQQLYPNGFATTVIVKGVSEPWEGEYRPGHFDGVATVVAKLFIACSPDIAIFGEKDWQQLAVIRRMVKDLGLPVEVIGHPTVREDDGLALSSRNALLSSEERKIAPSLAWYLGDIASAITRGAKPDAVIESHVELMKMAGFGPIDYVAYVDGESLESLDTYCPGGRLIAAATIGTTRLIDNIPVEV